MPVGCLCSPNANDTDFDRAGERKQALLGVVVTDGRHAIHADIHGFRAAAHGNLHIYAALGDLFAVDRQRDFRGEPGFGASGVNTTSIVCLPGESLAGDTTS